MPTREHIFKAKRKDNGEWVECSLIRCANKIDCFISTEKLILDCAVKCGRSVFNIYQVDPETVCEYTGVTDKNGKKIFEGDVVRDYMENCENEYDYDCFDCGRVFWYQQQSRFLRTSKLFPNDCAQMTENREYEVIGNIYDNNSELPEDKT